MKNTLQVLIGSLVLFLFSFGIDNFRKYSSDKALIEKYITLKDGESVYLSFDRPIFLDKTLTVEKPLVVKVEEKHPNDYGLMVSSILYNVEDLELFHFPEDNSGQILSGVVDANFDGHYKDFWDKKRDYPNALFRRLISNTQGREAMFNLLLTYYDYYSDKIPVTSKDRMINLLDHLCLFVENNLDSYRVEAEPTDFIPDFPAFKIVNQKNESVGIRNNASEFFHKNSISKFEAFLIRRNRLDKIPKSEILGFLKKFRERIMQSRDVSDYENAFNCSINGEILYRDNNYKIELYSLSSGKSIVINSGATLKYIEDNNTSYFKLTSENNVMIGLYDKDLNKVM